MTLIVSVRSLDGIVIAGDSLATFLNAPTVTGDIDIDCPACNHRHVTQAVLPGNAHAATTLSYAQKIFPFMDRFGVGIYSGLIVLGRTVHFAFREYEKQCQDEGQEFSGAAEAAKAAGDYLHGLLRRNFQQEGLDINDRPDGWTHNGFQLIGYDAESPVTYVATIGKTVEVTPYSGLDLTVCGDVTVSNCFFELYSKNQDSIPLIGGFSLQDAIEYAEFLVRTTALHQRFSQKIPTVGGEIDIALVTPFEGFQWVRQKKLYR
jgi:hypothetical protein